MKRLLFLVMMVVAVHAAEPVVAPAGGGELSVNASLTAYVFPEHGKALKQEQGIQVEVIKEDPSKPYCAQISFTCAGLHKLPAKTPLLAVVRARVVDGQEGNLIAKVQHGANPYTAFSSSTGFSVYAEWREYPILLMTDQDVSSERLQVVLFCGQKKQKVEIASMRLLTYPVGTDVSNFPRIRRSYVGREADAPWRKEALDRIEKIRKGDFRQVIRDAAGNPLANQEVTIELKRHAFGFGSAIRVSSMVDPSTDGEQVRKIVDDLFSMVVLENDLKDFEWAPEKTAEQKQKRNQRMEQTMAWLSERDIALRGHYLMQTATPQNLHGKSADEVRKHYLESARERLDFVGDRVIEWDVINHPVAWSGADLLTKHPGLERIDREVFSLAMEKTKLPMFINEDQIFRPGRQQDETYDYIVGLQAEKFPVAGLGNQAHFDESFLPSPQELLDVTDRFAKIVPTQVITEFDITTTADEQLAADFTRDTMIACFSHPAYHGFILWGFWEGIHWKPEAASWNKDWSIRKRGEVLRDLIQKEWHTKVTIKTDAEGYATWRGFPGVYTVQSGNTSLPKLRVSLEKNR